MVRVQITHDNTPIMKLGSIGKPSRKTAFITYKGEVPMSPKTMPRVTITPARLNFMPWFLLMAL